MGEKGTNFPPQTYSSSFFLNALTDDEKGAADTNSKRPNSTLLDCFFSTFLSGKKHTTNHHFDDDDHDDDDDDDDDDSENKLKNNIKTNDSKDIEVVDLWKKRHTKPVRNSTTNSNDPPHSAFKRWRKSKLTTPPTTDTKNGLINNPKIGENFCNRNGDDEMSLLKFLAINALDLSAPASDILLKSRNSNWFQLSGHPDSLAPAGPGTVWKKRSSGTDDTERIVYEELTKDPILCDIIPRYFREVEYKGEKFIELQDLLHGFQDPYVIDIKMGTRTFLESEVQKTQARTDLYQKMIAIDPNAPTVEEHNQKAVTKLRYMLFRELQSSTCSHGFRIEAMKCRGQPPVTNLKTVKSNDDVRNTLDRFLCGRVDVRQRLLQRLYEIRYKIEQSEYFQTREVIGSSLFIIYDDKKVGVWLIDFAKTSKLPDGVTVNHRTPWVQGNHEEGLLFGLDRLISVIESINTPLEQTKDSLQRSLPVTVKS